MRVTCSLWAGAASGDSEASEMEMGEEVHDSDDSVSDFGDEDLLDKDSVL